MSTDESFSKLKFATLNNPVHWLFTALSFRDAAKLVFTTVSPLREEERIPDGFVLAAPSHDSTNVYVFLVALALENLLKAEYVRRNPGLIRDRLPTDFTSKSHNLEHLAGALGLDLSSDERKTLQVAQEALVSWGRYPGGSRPGQGDVGPPRNFDPEAFKGVYEGLFERLVEVVAQDMRDE